GVAFFSPLEGACRAAVQARPCRAGSQGERIIFLQPRSGGFSRFGLSRCLWLKPNREKPPEGGSEKPLARPRTRPARAGLHRSAASPLNGAEERTRYTHPQTL